MDAQKERKYINWLERSAAIIQNERKALVQKNEIDNIFL